MQDVDTDSEGIQDIESEPDIFLTEDEYQDSGEEGLSEGALSSSDEESMDQRETGSSPRDIALGTSIMETTLSSQMLKDQTSPPPMPSQLRSSQISPPAPVVSNNIKSICGKSRFFHQSFSQLNPPMEQPHQTPSMASDSVGTILSPTITTTVQHS